MADRPYDPGRMPMPTRVLAVGNAYPPHHLGGYEIVWRGVTRRLRALGHQARVITTDYRRRDVEHDDPEDPDVYRELDWYWREHRWRTVSVPARLRLERHNAVVLDRHLEQFRPDVIAWWPVGGLSLGLIERVRRAGVPAVLFVHDHWLTYGRERDLWMRMWNRPWPARAFVERVTGLPTRVDYANAGRWLFCSRAVRDDALATGAAITDSAVLSPGISSAFLTAGRDAEPPEWRWRLLYIGRVVEQKGVASAIEALPLLPAEATLRIVGDGDRGYRDFLERLAARLRVGERVRFEPPRAHEALIAVYRSADAVLFPVEWEEPWGLVPLEAMALGRPVVATGRGGSGEYLVAGRNSLLFEPGDAADLATALHSLAGDPALRRRLCEGGYETAAAHGEDAFNRRAASEILGAARPAPARP
jgi:glycosyltransferase involved in cell wall biosynthesis